MRTLPRRLHGRPGREGWNLRLPFGGVPRRCATSPRPARRLTGNMDTGDPCDPPQAWSGYSIPVFRGGRRRSPPPAGTPASFLPEHQGRGGPNGATRALGQWRRGPLASQLKSSTHLQRVRNCRRGTPASTGRSRTTCPRARRSVAAVTPGSRWRHTAHPRVGWNTRRRRTP